MKKQSEKIRDKENPGEPDPQLKATKSNFSNFRLTFSNIPNTCRLECNKNKVRAKEVKAATAKNERWKNKEGLYQFRQLQEYNSIYNKILFVGSFRQIMFLYPVNFCLISNLP